MLSRTVYVRDFDSRQPSLTAVLKQSSRTKKGGKKVHSYSSILTSSAWRGRFAPEINAETESNSQSTRAQSPAPITCFVRIGEYTSVSFITRAFHGVDPHRGAVFLFLNSHTVRFGAVF